MNRYVPLQIPLENCSEAVERALKVLAIVGVAVFLMIPMTIPAAAAGWESDTEVDFGDSPRDVSYSPDGNHVAVAGGYSIKVYNTTTWNVDQEIATLKDQLALSVAYSPDGDYLAYGMWGDAEVEILNTTDWTSHNVIDGISTGAGSVEFSSDGSELAIGGWDNTVYIADTDGVVTETITEAGDTVYDISLHPTARYIAFASADGGIYIYDREADSFPQRGISVEGADSANAVEFSQDGEDLLAGYDSGDVLMLVESDGGWPIQTSRSVKETNAEVTDVSFSPNGIGFAYSVDAYNTGSSGVYIHDRVNGDLEYRLLDGTRSEAVSFASDSSQLVAGDWIADSLHVYDAPSISIEEWSVETGDGRTLTDPETTYNTNFGNEDTFRIDGVDGNLQHVKWYVNGALEAENGSEFAYQWDEPEFREHTVTAEAVSDYNKTDTLTWTVNLVDPDEAAEIVDWSVMVDGDRKVSETEYESGIGSNDTFTLESKEDVSEVWWYVNGERIQTANVSSSGPFSFSYEWDDTGEQTVIGEVVNQYGGSDYLAWDVTVYDILIGGRDSYSESEGGTITVEQRFEVFGVPGAEIDVDLEYNDSVLRKLAGPDSDTVVSGNSRTWEFQIRESDYHGQPITIAAQYGDREAEKMITLSTYESGGIIGDTSSDLVDSILSRTWLDPLGGFERSTYFIVQSILTTGILGTVWLHHWGRLELPVVGQQLKRLQTKSKVFLTVAIGTFLVGFAFSWWLVVSGIAAIVWYQWAEVGSLVEGITEI